MSEEIEYAFPGEDSFRYRLGMTLRDYFAGQALTGIIANPNAKQGNLGWHVGEAYRYADEMLMRRQGAF
jgi:hypothetical protein